jgi:putative transposase
MRTYSLTVGLVVRRGDRTRRLERHLEDGQLVFIDQVSGTPHTMTPAVLQRLVLAGDLEIVSGDPASEVSTGVSAPLVKTLNDLPEHQAKEVRRRYRYVIYMKRKGLRHGMRKRLAEALEALNGRIPMGEATDADEKDPSAPRESTVMDWMKRWETSGGNLMSLLTRHAVRVTPKRLDPRVLKIGRGQVRTFYCTKRRPTINDTKEQIETALNADKTLDTKTISISTVRRLIDEICPYERDVTRFGAAYARHKWRYSLKGIGADRPMQRYEIDHTVLDVVVICDRTGMPLGRPTITIVVDAFSGLVAGIFISFWGTGLAATLAALKVAISPKDEYVTQNRLAVKWLPFGIPCLMVVDNGLEFHSPQFHDIAMYLSMDLRFCAVRQPWLKPFVERTLGELHGYLPHQGRVEKRLNNYLPPKPEKSATITFGSLCTGLLKAFVEIHPFEVNERKLWLPFERFSEGMEKLLPPSLPTSTAELDLIVAVTKEYTVGNEGVVPNYLRFNSGELQDLRRAVGTDFRTLIKFNPEDLSLVHVQDPRTKGWLPVQSCMPEYTDGLSIVQHKAIRAQLKGKVARKDISDRLLKAKTELTELWNSSAVIGKRLQAAQLRALSGLTSSHALRGATAAASDAPPPPPAPTPERLLTPEDLKVPEIEVPDFDAYMAV